LEGVRLDGAYPLAVWAVLKPREAVTKAVMAPGGEENPPAPRDAQDCVVVEYLVAGVLPGVIGWAAGLWTLEIVKSLATATPFSRPIATPLKRLDLAYPCSA
jgi:hypothetical protein